MRFRSMVCSLAVGVLGAAGLLAVPAPAPAPSPVPPPGSCANLLALQITDTTIKSAEEVSGPSFTPPGSSNAIRNLPVFCRVVAVTKPAITVEVWLPLATWNGKFQGVGNGGTAGTISYGALAAGIRRGYATASTDTGHVSKDSADSTWALGRMDLLADFGFRGIHVMTVDGKQITHAFYDTQPRLAYYVGCSKGGAQGLAEAQRYPDDYDGLVAGDPANTVRNFLAGHLWMALATLKDPDSYIPASKLPVLTKAVVDACDGLDGIKDGVIDDPRQCKFDPATLTCKAGQDQATCFTTPQVQAIKAIWAGAHNSKGEQIYPGYEPGDESVPGSWDHYEAGNGPLTGRAYQLADGFLKYAAMDDPNYDFRNFSYDRDFPKVLAKLGPVVDATDPDLVPLEQRGSKLIVYHGWNDPSVPPMATVNYYESVISTVGGAKDRESAIKKTQAFFRVFMVPGMTHCSGGPGTDHFDMLTALENWVEKGAAPDRIVASHITAGKVDRTRPLCPYPQVALYTGSGSTDDAANFVCGTRKP